MTSRCGVFSRRSTGALVSVRHAVELGKDESIAIMFSVIAAASVIVHFVLGDKPGGPKTGRFFRRPAYYFSEIKTENHTMPIRCDFGSRGAFWGLKTPKSDSPFFMKRRKVTSVSGRVPIAIVSLADTHRPSPDTPWPLFSAPPAFPAPPPRRCSRPAGTRSPSSAPPAASASPAACS